MCSCGVGRVIMEKTCKKCGKLFYKKDNESINSWNKRLYCSHSCANSVNHNGHLFVKGMTAFNKGKKGLSGESNSLWKRINKKCIVCGKDFVVKHYRKDTAKFCSKKCSEIYRDEGKTSENERIRKSKEYRSWRELVFERDDWTCQKCLSRGKELNPHHIIGFSDDENLRFDINNGITLCRKCHYEFHTKYGFTNNTKGQMEEFLEEA